MEETSSLRVLRDVCSSTTQQDIFGADTTPAAHHQRLELQARQKQTRGGRADTSGLPIFEQDQTDLFTQ